MTDNIHIREIRQNEIVALEDLLYEAIYQPDKQNPIPRSVLQIPEIAAYINDFGSKKDDHCFVADYNGKIIGAVWVRILNGEIKGYGNVDDETPEFSISLFKEYRNQGIGTAMMKKMIDYLNKKGYSQASLSVQKGNYASKLYKKLGFEVIKDENEDYLMVLKLSKLSKNL
ncbi:N-acetyltransferase family protein [Petrimonas sp.]|uniref:GNAT family N-acetyltransferase n=1 Tax=Petrimonas sp. TaxID=2023866 RepID=UPI003F50E774